MKTEQVLIRLNPQLRETLFVMAEEDNRSVSNYIETLILREIKRQEREAA